jgi:hypothetical protein
LRSPCKSGWTDHFSGPVGNYQSPALRTRFSEGGSPSRPAIFPPRGANRSGSRLLSGLMVVQIHPWRLSEGEPARSGHPFEAGRATATSLGIETSTFRHWRENRARPGTCWKHVGSAERRLWSMTTSLRHFWRANPESPGAASKAIGPAPPVVMRVHRPSPLARSSKAEQPPDKRQTPERYRSGQPFLESESSKRGDAVLTRSASLPALRGRTSALRHLGLEA